MNLKKIISYASSLLIVISITTSAIAQTATITGRIINANNEGVAYVNVGFQGTQKGSASDKRGRFQIQNITPGTYTLVVSSVGFRTVRKKLTLKSGQKMHLNIHLAQRTEHLQSLIVQGERDNPLVEERSAEVSKMPVKRIDDPQSYVTIPQKLFNQQLAVSYEDIFKNISGSNVLSTTTHGRLDLASRGFETRSFTRDGVNGLTHTAIDPANIAKVEYLKGPSATLYGSNQSGYGGLADIITKKPYPSLGGDVSYTGGSFGLNRLSIDVNTPFNKKRTVLFRLDAAGTHKNSYTDAGYKKSIFMAPDLTWQISDRLNLEIQGQYYNLSGTTDFYFSPQKNTTIDRVQDLGIDFHNSFNPNGINYTGKTGDVHATLNAQLSNNWTSKTDVVTNFDHDGGYKIHFHGLTDSTLTPTVEDEPTRYRTIDVQQNFNNSYKVGRIKNEFLIGLDFFRYNERERKAKANVDTVNFINPGSNYDDFTDQLIHSYDLPSKQSDKTTIQNTYAAYGSDIITFNKRWTAMVGLRVDRFQSRGTKNNKTGEIDGKYGQTAVSYKAGVVYQPIVNRFSLFANYLNGFQNVNGANYAGDTFSPTQAGQIEGGIKLNLFHHRLTSRLSYYNISVSNVLRDDPLHQEYKQQSGKQLSRGIEFRVTTHPLTGLNLIAGFAHNLFKFKDISKELNGRRDPHSGPKNTANFWASYLLTKGSLRGLGVGFGGIYGSRQSEIKHGPVGHRFYRPAYTVLDASIFYKHGLYRISVKLNNLNNEKYWTNRLALKEPRAILGRVTVGF